MQHVFVKRRSMRLSEPPESRDLTLDNSQPILELSMCYICICYEIVWQIAIVRSVTFLSVLILGHARFVGKLAKRCGVLVAGGVVTQRAITARPPSPVYRNLGNVSIPNNTS
ncbi:hypothetical protein ACJJTC_005645 [Scirpophaga incertulas]